MPGARPIGAIALLVLFGFVCNMCVAAVGPLFMDTFGPNTYYLNQIEEEKIFAVLEIRKLSISDATIQAMADGGASRGEVAGAQELDGAILARLVLVDGSNRCLPEDCSFAIIPTTVASSTCGYPKTMRIIARIVNPNIPAMENGYKTKIIHLGGMIAVGENDCEVGPKFEFQDEKGHFSFVNDILGKAVEVIKKIPRCSIGVFFRGTLEFRKCAEIQYYETQQLVGLGPIPEAGTGLYVYTVTAHGLAMYNVNDFAELTHLRTMFQSADVLDEESIDAMNAFLLQIDTQLQMNQNWLK